MLVTLLFRETISQCLSYNALSLSLSLSLFLSLSLSLSLSDREHVCTKTRISQTIIISHYFIRLKLLMSCNCFTPRRNAVAMGSSDTLMSAGVPNGNVSHGAPPYRPNSIDTPYSRKISTESKEVSLHLTMNRQNSDLSLSITF